MENQISSGPQPSEPKIPDTQPVEQKNKGRMWKIISIILGIIIIIFIAIFAFLFWASSYLEKHPNILTDNQQQATIDTNKDDNTTPVEDYIAIQSESSEYSDFADKVVAELAKGNIKYLSDNLSLILIADNSQETVDKVFLPAVKKLFINFDHIGRSVTIQPSSDENGNSGYSFAMTIVYKDSTKKDIKIYIFKEDGNLVVRNIVA